MYQGFLIDQSFTRNINYQGIKETNWPSLCINSKDTGQNWDRDWLLLGSIPWKRVKK